MTKMVQNLQTRDKMGMMKVDEELKDFQAEIKNGNI